MTSIFWTSLAACFSCSSSASFLRLPLPVITFLSFCLLLVCSPPPAFLGFSGFHFLSVVCLSCGSGCGSTFLYPLVFAFPHATVRTAPCVLSQSSFPHAVATVGCFRSSSAIFRLLRFWLSLPVSLLLSVCCVFFSSLVFFTVFCILRLRLLFAFDPPPVVFHAADSPLAVPRLPGCCFPCISDSFLLPGFSLPASCFFLVPWAAFSPLVSVPHRACCSVLRSGFGSFSAGSTLQCCFGF